MNVSNFVEMQCFSWEAIAAVFIPFGHGENVLQVCCRCAAGVNFYCVFFVSTELSLKVRHRPISNVMYFSVTLAQIVHRELPRSCYHNIFTLLRNFVFPGVSQTIFSRPGKAV